MKIAVISDEGINISQHFGRAPYYVVAEVDDGTILNKETRDKMGHHTFAGGHDEEHLDSQGRRGYGQEAHDKHTMMAEAIKDCQVLICGGMGWGAYESMKNFNIDVFVTDNLNIDEAIKLYLAGKLDNLMERLH